MLNTRAWAVEACISHFICGLNVTYRFEYTRQRTASTSGRRRTLPVAPSRARIGTFAAGTLALTVGQGTAQASPATRDIVRVRGGCVAFCG